MNNNSKQFFIYLIFITFCKLVQAEIIVTDVDDDDDDWVKITSNEELKKIEDEEKLAMIARRSPERGARIDKHRAKAIETYNKSDLASKKIARIPGKLTFKEQPETEKDKAIRSLPAKKQEQRLIQRKSQRKAKLAYKNSFAGKIDAFKNKISNWWHKDSDKK